MKNCSRLRNGGGIILIWPNGNAAPNPGERTMFAVQAQPRDGLAEMTCSVHETENEANAERKRQEAKRGDRWLFSVEHVVEID